MRGPQSASLPPNPSLVAILLLTQTRAGSPHLVFHYPAVPSRNPFYTKRDPNWYGTPGFTGDESAEGSDEWSDSSESNDGSSDEDVAGSGSEGESSRGTGTGSRGKKSMRSKSGDIEDEALEGSEKARGEDNQENAEGKQSKKGQQEQQEEKMEWDSLLGFPAEELAALLKPARLFNKRKYEVGIEQFVFVGGPIFIREDGFWKKRRRHRKRESVDVKKARNEGIQQDVPDGPAPERERNGDSHEDEASEAGLGKVLDLVRVPGFDPGYGHGLVSGAASELGSDAKSTSTTAGQNELVMFSLVFVLNPPSLEHHIRVDEMYDCVVKRFAKVLKAEQALNNYVAQEARLILQMKEKARETKAPIVTLWPNIVASSSLARAIAVTFDSISTNKIAHITMSDSDTSFQIPQAISTPFIPTATEPQMPGLWLTTATLIDDDDIDVSLSPHSALLLLEDDDALLKEVESDGKELSGPLSFFIRNLTPTKSLLKLSQRHSMPLKDVQFLARHLIYWRRARAIPPLHYRDIYVVSPNADLRALTRAMGAFSEQFPSLPPLTQILHGLSGQPRQYRHLMPSQDHRTAYMKILEWLMRGGWVTQLRTFGWVRVTGEVKAAVAAKQNREARHSATRIQIGDIESGPGNELEDNARSSPQVQRSPESRGVNEGQHPHSSPLLSPYRHSAGPPSDAGSTSSSRTAVHHLPPPSPLQRPEGRVLHRPSPLHKNQSASPSSAEDDSTSASQAYSHASESTHDTDSASQLGATSTIFTGNGGTDSSFEFKSENPSDYEPSLVHSPQKASHEESAWIEHIGSLVPGLFPDIPATTTNGAAATNGHDAASGPSTSKNLPNLTEPATKELWPLLLKYFDGRYALEEISAREGLKKKIVREFLNRLMREDILVTVRHW